MVPRGSNGAGQAILDTRALALALSSDDDPLEHYRTVAGYSQIRLRQS
ncbi:MAG TPA: hypothetical protein VK735_01925 [Pseudonocardia sp.]|nr:hypothetical protein [Pseudonocardia sp.]HTF46184.1 hypothetical protein [Pseudonocardia sp.]